MVVGSLVDLVLPSAVVAPLGEEAEHSPLEVPYVEPIGLLALSLGLPLKHRPQC